MSPDQIKKALLRPADLQLACPDAHLLTLRSALLDAWEDENRLSSQGKDGWVVASDQRSALARQMIDLRAFTLAGLQAKAIAVARSC
jgi:hypothetical protein